jgi:ankyrin repeat protein
MVARPRRNWKPLANESPSTHKEIMALINCYECGRKISDAAPACPSCGAPKKKLTPHKSPVYRDAKTFEKLDANKDGVISKEEFLREIGDIETADLLSKHGGKSGAEDSIHLAVEAGNIEAVKQQIAAGADINEKSDGGARQPGWTPLHIAAIFDRKEITELLIAEGADVNAKNKRGTTPLNQAAALGHTNVAALLIAARADVNAKNKWGSTALNQAVERGRKETAELLIAKGADVNAKAKDGETPLDSAIEFKHPEIADLLRKHGGKTSEELKAEVK